jgi:hypothetical protein
MKYLFIPLLMSTLLAACACGSHRDFIEGRNARLGKHSFRNADEYSASHKTLYKGEMVYTNRVVDKISFNGEELVSTGKYCEVAFIIDAKTSTYIDWKYLKGSNPKACVICGY